MNRIIIYWCGFHDKFQWWKIKWWWVVVSPIWSNDWFRYICAQPMSTIMLMMMMTTTTKTFSIWTRFDTRCHFVLRNLNKRLYERISILYLTLPLKFTSVDFFIIYFWNSVSHFIVCMCFLVATDNFTSSAPSINRLWISGEIVIVCPKKMLLAYANKW